MSRQDRKEILFINGETNGIDVWTINDEFEVNQWEIFSSTDDCVIDDLLSHPGSDHAVIVEHCQEGLVTVFSKLDYITQEITSLGSVSGKLANLFFARFTEKGRYDLSTVMGGVVTRFTFSSGGRCNVFLWLG